MIDLVDEMMNHRRQLIINREISHNRLRAAEYIRQDYSLQGEPEE